MIETILLLGVISSVIYALLALGFTLIYGVARVVNLAHGAFFMLGGYAFFTLMPLLLYFIQFEPIRFPIYIGGTSEWIIILPETIAAVSVLILAAIFVGIVGGISYRLFVHPVIEDEIAVMVVTVSLAIVFQQLMLLGFGPSFIYVPSLLEGSIRVLDVTLTFSRLLAFTVSLGLFFGLWVFIAKSKIGSAMRALSQDREAAMLMGINTERLYMLTMGISASFAAIAGIFIAASTGATSPYAWLRPLAMSFAIVILGGLGSIKGTIIGGFIIGYTETIVSLYVPEGGYIVPAVPFAIMVLTLFLRPKGLFGKRIEMEE